MEIDYRLPLCLKAVALEDRPNDQGVQRLVINYKAFVEWQDIVAIKEFVEHSLFPYDHKDIDKTTLITKTGAYILIGNVDNYAKDWAMYKRWKCNQLIFNVN